MLKNEKGQAVAPKTVTRTKKGFEDQGNTRVYWLGGGGAMINDHGTVIMIDPLLEGFDMPLLIDMPIDVKDVPHVDAILVSHVDNDHYSRPTCRDLKDVCKEYHSSYYVASLLDMILAIIFKLMILMLNLHLLIMLGKTKSQNIIIVYGKIVNIVVSM